MDYYLIKNFFKYLRTSSWEFPNGEELLPPIRAAYLSFLGFLSSTVSFVIVAGEINSFSFFLLSLLPSFICFYLFLGWRSWRIENHLWVSLSFQFHSRFGMKIIPGFQPSPKASYWLHLHCLTEVISSVSRRCVWGAEGGKVSYSAVPLCDCLEFCVDSGMDYSPAAATLSLCYGITCQGSTGLWQIE